MAVMSTIPPFTLLFPYPRTFPQPTLKFQPITHSNRSSSRRNLSLSAQSNGNGTNGVDGVEERRKTTPAVLDWKRWRDLLSADPENIAAVGLTGLLAWASVQALFQLVCISVAIILAAVKYSFIAALLLFIMITLL